MPNCLEPIKVQVQLNKQDVLYLSYKSIFNDYSIGFGAGALVLGLIYYASLTSARYKAGIILGLVIVILSLIVIIYIVNKKAFDNEKIKELNSKYSFSQFAIEIQGAEGLSTLEWDSVFNLEETSKYFLIYKDKESFYVIPKRCFKDCSEMDDLRGLFERKIHEKKLELI